MAPKVRKIEELRRELAAKERQLEALLKQRRKIAAKLESLDKGILALGGEIPSIKRKPGRPPGSMKVKRKPGRPRKSVNTRTPTRRIAHKPLVEYIKQVLGKSKVSLRCKDIMTAVKKAGYKSASKNFYGIVAAALRDTKNFKRVSRGAYTSAK